MDAPSATTSAAPEAGTSAATPLQDPVLAETAGKIGPFERQVRRALRRRVYLQAAGIWALTRLILLLFTFVAVAFDHARSSPQPGSALQRASITPHLLVAAWNHWDTRYFYAPLAVNGYDLHTTHSTIFAAFFPLYPLLVHLVTLVPGVGPRHTVAAGLLVSNLALLVALLGIAACVLEYGRPGERTPRYAALSCWLVVAAPLAFFLSAAYSDSLLLAAATWSLVLVRRRLIVPAALCACLAALDHVTAVALVPALLYELGRQRSWWRGASWRHGRALPRLLGELLAMLLCVPLGIGIFAAYCAHVYGHWDQFVRSERTWFGQTPMWPWQAIGTIVRSLAGVPLGSYMQVRQLVDVLPLVFVWALLLIRLKGSNRLPVTLTLFLAALVYLAISAPVRGTLFPDPALAAGRHLLLGAAPITLALLPAIRRWPWLETALLCAGFLLQGLFAVFFLHGGWLV